ncbi:MAG: L,D-transpeptidase [Acidobacteriota bacterium]
MDDKRPENSNIQNVSNVNQPIPVSNSNTSSTAVKSHDPVTLPLIDAMLSDEQFAEEARAVTGLSLEELTKVRDAARDAVLKLNESESDDSRSTRAAETRAKEKIESIIGAGKATAFIAYIGQKTSGDDLDRLTSAAPNAVPSDTRIVVNAPAYRMDIFRDGKLVKTYSVGIGYPEFPLPAGLRKAQKIIFNPTWTPPDEPWVKGRFAPGKTVEAGSRHNPLGPIKIPIGLPSLIHGGKAPGKIGTFASHGCVGLTNKQINEFAIDLASLSGSSLTTDEIQKYLSDASKTKEVDLTEAVPVELRYETIVISDGKLTIYRDVYERGTNTEANLKRVFDAVGVSFDSLDSAEKEKILSALNEMAVDAQGQPVDDTNDAKNETNSKNTSGKVTRSIKGKKMIEIPLSKLVGKGYPPPANA